MMLALFSKAVKRSKTRQPRAREAILLRFAIRRAEDAFFQLKHNEMQSGIHWGPERKTATFHLWECGLLFAQCKEMHQLQILSITSRERLAPEGCPGASVSLDNGFRRPKLYTLYTPCKYWHWNVEDWFLYTTLSIDNGFRRAKLCTLYTPCKYWHWNVEDWFLYTTVSIDNGFRRVEWYTIHSCRYWYWMRKAGLCTLL